MSVRLTYRDGFRNHPTLENAKDGIIQVAEIIEKSDYYPFGLKQKGNDLPDYSAINKYKYGYGGKELNDELGLDLYDFGARNYDPAIGRWLNIDPLAENSRRWTPYNYAYNNPIYFVDPDGMQAAKFDDLDDVIIKGNMANEAFNDLQNSVKDELSLKMSNNGKVTTKKIGNGELSQGAADLLAATKDRSVTVNINADSDILTSNKMSCRTGNFMGATYNEDGTVSTKQEVQPDLLKKFDEANKNTIGQSMLHEATESYKAGKLAQESKYSVGFATEADYRDPNTIIYRAHNGVTPASGSLKIEPTNIKDGYPQQINFYTGNNNSILFYQYNFKF